MGLHSVLAFGGWTARSFIFFEGCSAGSPGDSCLGTGNFTVTAVPFSGLL
jgi:hypothetical protein